MILFWMIMPVNAAKRLAGITTVTTEELEAMFACVNQKLASAAERNEPVPLLDYRSKIILTKTLEIRRTT